MTKYKASPGDYVEVSLVKRSYKGFLLESPKSEKGNVLLKLDSGYNIGFDKKKIICIDVLRKASKSEENVGIKMDREKPNIAMVITGGTIASRYDPKTGGVSPLTSPDDLFRFYPELFGKVNVSKVEVPFMKSSESMDFKDWKRIARTAEKLLNDSNIKGVIITHGTDTLHYTSAALSFFMGNLGKPVVLTYSQRSVDRASSDANLNLQCSALASISNIAEVMLVGHATTNDDYCFAMPGTKVKKMHTSRRDAFKTINTEPFAKIFPDRIEKVSKHNFRDSKKKVKIDARFEEKVALVKVYPGQDSEILDYYVKKKYKGVVLEATGLGHVPGRDSKKSWIKKLKEVQKKGLIVCATAQTVYGRLDPFVYSNGREIMETGVIYLKDILAEAALIKLGWVLGHNDWTKSHEKVREKMLENIAGEFSDRLEHDDVML